MTQPMPNWLINLLLGDDRLNSYGLLSPEKPTQTAGRMTRQRRRSEA
jgi:hypothetical protein